MELLLELLSICRLNMSLASVVYVSSVWGLVHRSSVRRSPVCMAALPHWDEWPQKGQNLKTSFQASKTSTTCFFSAFENIIPGMQGERSGCHFQDKSHVNWNISVSFLLTAPIKGADYMQSFDERGARGAAVIGQLFCGSLSLQCRQCSNQKVACNLLNYHLH